MRVNYHLHSRYSDGTIWPDAIARRAKAAGLDAAALTDHDTLGGVPEFTQAARELGLQPVAGVEIDCREPSLDYKSELLVYFPDGAYQHSREFLEETTRFRLSSMQAALEAAKTVFASPSLDFSLLLDRKRAGRPQLPAERFSFNKVDVFLLLRDLELLEPGAKYGDFKKQYFDSGLLAIQSREKPLCTDIVALANKDAGLVVVPHIGHEFDDDYEAMVREKDRLADLLRYFKDIGVKGVELYCYRQQKSDAINQLVTEVAAPLGFFFTYGSDCHGPGSGKDTIELFSGDFDAFPHQEPLSQPEK